MSNVRLFVGCAPDCQDVEFQMALEYSVRSRTSEPVEITWMRLSRDSSSPFYSNPETGEGWRSHDWTTPFTPFRFIVPWLCNFEGRAIYCDSDVIFLDDIAVLFNATMQPGRAFMSKTPRRTCVTLWDSSHPGVPHEIDDMREGSKLKWRELWKQRRAGLWQPFDLNENWNCIDGEGMPIGDTVKAIHFSDIATQPHLLAARNRLGRGKHWYTGEVKDHPRRDLVAILARELQLARESGLDESMYFQNPPFGPVPMADLSGYRDGKL